MEDFERQKADLAKESERNRTGADRFVGKNDSMEDALKKSTIGLVHLEDFQKLRSELEEEKKREAARTNELKADERSAKKNKKAKKERAKLSFAYDDEEEEGGAGPPSSITRRMESARGKQTTPLTGTASMTSKVFLFQQPKRRVSRTQTSTHLSFPTATERKQNDACAKSCGRNGYASRKR